MSRCVLVTGAAGFIGRAVVARLAADGWSVRAGVRNTPLPEVLANLAAVTEVPCDLDGAEGLAEALAGVDLVVHAAYGDEAAMPRQLETLLAAATAAGVKRFIEFSSIAVYGVREGTVVETDEPAGGLPAYAGAKLACEKVAGRWANADRARRVLILRPGIVYGPGSRYWTEKLELRIRAGAWGTFGSDGEGFAALVHVADVADAVARGAAWCRDDTSARRLLTVNIVGPDHPTWNRYFTAVAASLDETLRPLNRFQLALRLVIAPFAKVLRRLRLPGPRKPTLAPGWGELAIFARKAVYSGDEAAESLGWRAKVTMEEGVSGRR